MKILLGVIAVLAIGTVLTLPLEKKEEPKGIIFNEKWLVSS